MKKSPSPAPPVTEGCERHQYVFFISRKDYNDLVARGDTLANLLIGLYGFSFCFLSEKVQDDEAGIAFHTYVDHIVV